MEKKAPPLKTKAFLVFLLVTVGNLTHTVVQGYRVGIVS